MFWCINEWESVTGPAVFFTEKVRRTTRNTFCSKFTIVIILPDETGERNYIHAAMQMDGPGERKVA